MRDIAIKDNYAYVAEDYYFEVFNISNPRQPYLVGRCNLPEGSDGIFIKDSLAFEQMLQIWQL